MATISVSVQSTLINPANFYAVAIYDASNLGTVLEFIAPTKGAGYTNPFQITFLNSYTANKLYRVIVWENTTAVVGGTSRVSTDVKASVNQTTVRADKVYTYGISAEMTDTVTIVDATIIGWGISFELFGTGTLTLGTDYTYNSATGTIVLINGMAYQNGQKMVVHFLPQVTATAPSSSGISAGRVLATSGLLTSADSNSAIYLQGSGGSFIATLPALSTMTDYQPIEFYSFGGNHIYATLLCAGTDKIQWSALRTKLFMRQATNLTLFKANGVWNVKGNTSPMDMVGEIIYKYGKTDFPYLLADGSAGGLISRSAYSGLFDYFQGLPAAAITTEAQWGNASALDGVTYFPNKGLWTPGDGSTNFRVPLLVNQFIRGADGSARQPGSFQADAMQTHEHAMRAGGVGGSYTNGKGPVTTVGGYSGSFSLNSDLSSAPYNLPGSGNAGTLLTRVDVETRPENISLYALIRL